MVAAALTRPWVVGWSGISERNISKWFLNSKNSPEFSFLRFWGRRYTTILAYFFKDVPELIFHNLLHFGDLFNLFFQIFVFLFDDFFYFCFCCSFWTLRPTVFVSTFLTNWLTTVLIKNAALQFPLIWKFETNKPG